MKNINRNDYENIAGPNWPKFDDYINGNTNSIIDKELQQRLIGIDADKKDKESTVYDYVLSTHPRGPDHDYNFQFSCNRPKKTVTIDSFGNCCLCICDGWIPNPVGKITDFQQLEDIWKNPISTLIQKDVESKTHTWCAVEHCGILFGDNIEEKYKLIFGIDDSCNLQCPSCRRELRMHKSGPEFEMKLNAVTHAVDLLHKFAQPIHITLACSGDPLASNIYRPLLHSYKGKDNQTFTLFTNGLLIKKQLEKVNLLERITEFNISVDAGSKDVYEKVRLGGKWDILLENLNFLKEIDKIHLVDLQFIVQRNNYKDIFNFVELANRYGCSGTITELIDWGTWIAHEVKVQDQWTKKHGTYFENNVLDPRHPEFNKCIEILLQIKEENISLTPPIVKILKENASAG